MHRLISVRHTIPFQLIQEKHCRVKQFGMGFTPKQTLRLLSKVDKLLIIHLLKTLIFFQCLKPREKQKSIKLHRWCILKNNKMLHVKTRLSYLYLRHLADVLSYSNLHKSCISRYFRKTENITCKEEDYQFEKTDFFFPQMNTQCFHILQINLT